MSSGRRDRDQYGRRYVRGSGPAPAKYMLVGEAPGKEENNRGVPFIGKSGKELGRYLKQATGIERRDVYVTNLVKYRPLTDQETGNKSPTLDDVARDEGDLAEEIERVRPKWILACGWWAIQWFMADPEVDVEDVRGFAWPGLERAQGAVVIAVTHPAAGLHQNDRQPFIWDDFKRAGLYIRRKLEPVPPADQYPDPDYYEVTHEMYRPPERTDIAVDTEGPLGYAWCATYSMLPGSGGLVKRANKKAVAYFKNILLTNTIWMHNAPYDFRVLAELTGVPLLDLLYKVKFHDTMQMAYVLRLEPKGLKPLIRRRKGMKQRQFLDVIRPAERKVMVAFLRSILRRRCEECGGLGEVMVRPKHKTSGKLLPERPVRCEPCAGDGTSWAPPPETIEWDWKQQRVKLSRGHGMGARVRGILKDLDRIDPRTGRPVNLRGRWESIKNKKYEFAVQVEDALGPPAPASFDDVDPKVAMDYAIRDADGTRRIGPDLKADLEREGLWDVYEVDRRTIPMFTRMMDVGWKIDVDYLHRLTAKLEIRQDKLMYQLEQLIGHPINPGSSEQVGEYLFEVLGLHPVRKTDTGMDSTDNTVLSDLRILCNAHLEDGRKYRTGYEFTSLVLAHRELNKLRTTYTLPLPRLVDGNGRLHSDISNVGTATRRPSSRDPNILNISKRTDNGKLVRGAFVCDPGNVIVEADFSQIEFRLVANEAKEWALIKAINKGLDPHALTTSKIFEIPLAKVTRDMWQRDASKTLGFAILFGASAPSVKMQIKLQSSKGGRAGIDVPVEQVQVWIDDYTGDKGYPAIGDWISENAAEARRDGYVADMWGHRRYLPGARSELGSVKAESDRIATNHKAQAGAAGIIKQAMIEIWEDVLPRYRSRGYCEPLLQAYDALNFEVSRGMAGEFVGELARVMRGAVKLDVKMDVDATMGERWNKLEKVEA